MKSNAELLAEREQEERERAEREARVRRDCRHNVMKKATRKGGNGFPSVQPWTRTKSVDDGVTHSRSGVGIVVTIHDNAKGRRDLKRHCDREGLSCAPLSGEKVVIADEPDTVESLTAFGVRRNTLTTYRRWQDGTYNRRTGELNPPSKRKADKRTAEGSPTADYLCVGSADAVRTLLHHSAVSSWRWNEAHHIPFRSAGSGPEKQRPPMGSAFGRPEQISATAEALASRPRENVAADEFPDIRHDTVLPASPADTSPDIALDPKPTWPLPRREW